MTIAFQLAPAVEVRGWTIIAIERVNVAVSVEASFFHGAGHKDVAALILLNEERVACVDVSGEVTPLDAWLARVPALAAALARDSNPASDNRLAR
jgi:hypothetical protein